MNCGLASRKWTPIRAALMSSIAVGSILSDFFTDLEFSLRLEVELEAYLNRSFKDRKEMSGSIFFELA
jgi:hypothetical protein